MKAQMPPGAQVDDKSVKRVEAIVDSMTPKERRNPRVIDGSRRRRIAKGSGTSVQEVNRLLRDFEEMERMLKRFKNVRGKMRFPARRG
jgi:signal recognition particle subunit SRP54